MSEGFNEATVRRGRRDPELQAALEAEEDLTVAAGQNSEADVEYVGLFEGSPVILKVTLFAKTPLGDAWITAGTQDHVAEGENSKAAFKRVSDVISEEVMNFGTSVVEAIEAVQSNQPPRRIRPAN